MKSFLNFGKQLNEAKATYTIKDSEGNIKHAGTDKDTAYKTHKSLNAKEPGHKLYKNGVSCLNEVLSKDADAGTWIDDFVKSDNPKFAGKSAEKRKQMALAAYYTKQKNESDSSWEKSMEKKKEDRLSDKDKGTLGKVRDLLAKQKNESVETPEQEKARKELDLKLSKWKNQQRAAKTEGVKQVRGDDSLQYEETELDESLEYVVYNGKSGAVHSVHKSKDKAENAKSNLSNHKIGSRKAGSDNSFVSEEVEELDELSNKLLNRYSKKAEKEAGKNFMAADRAQDRGKYDKAQAHMDKADKRASGVYRAQSKIKEESLDEISKDTLSSYAHKAFAQGNDLHYDLAHSKGDKATDAERQAIKDKISKRNAGVIKASQKMNKEDMDEAVDIIKKNEKGDVISFSHEGDWEKSSTKNGGARGRGKASHLSEVGLKTIKKLNTEEVELVENDLQTLFKHEKAAGYTPSAGESHYARKVGNKIHIAAHDDDNGHYTSSFNIKSKGGGDYSVLPIIKHKSKAEAIAAVNKKAGVKEEVELDESAWGRDKMSSLRQAHDRHMEKALAANKAGDDTAVKTHQRKMQMIQGKMQKLKQNEEVELGEECDILVELSKGTLKSYVGKAVQSHGSNRVIANMAWDKSEKPGDLLDKLGHKSLKDSKKRSIGIAKAVDKLTKEEVEEFMQTEAYDQLDEVDKKTLGYYISKSHDQLRQHSYQLGSRYAKDFGAAADHEDEYKRKENNRTQGIKTAVKKLTKEENLDELSKSTLGSYVKKASDQSKRAAVSANQSKHTASDAMDSGNSRLHDLHANNYRYSKNLEKKRDAGVDKAVNKLTKEDTMLTYSEFMAQLAEGKADDLRDKLAADRERRLDKYDYSKEKDSKVSPVKNVKGHSYGAGEDSEEGEDEVKTAKPAAVKRGRGRPAGSKSGARV